MNAKPPLNNNHPPTTALPPHKHFVLFGINDKAAVVESQCHPPWADHHLNGQADRPPAAHSINIILHFLIITTSDDRHRPAAWRHRVHYCHPRIYSSIHNQPHPSSSSLSLSLSASHLSIVGQTTTIGRLVFYTLILYLIPVRASPLHVSSSINHRPDRWNITAGWCMQANLPNHAAAVVRN